MDSFSYQNTAAVIHIPRLDIDDEDYELLSGRLIRPDPRKIYDLDENWIRESFLEKSRPVFFFYNNFERKKTHKIVAKVEIATTLNDLQKKIDIFLFVLVALTGAELISTRNSTSYILGGDLCRVTPLVGQFGRNLINHNPAPIKISQEYIKTAIQISMLWVKCFERKILNIDLLSGFYTLESLCFSSIYPVFKCLPIVTAMESLLIPEIKCGIQKALQKEVISVLGETACEDDIKLIKRAYNLRSRIIHGDSKKILNDDNYRTIYYEIRVIFGKVLFMKINNELSLLMDLEENAK